jgi:SulP family sulfate permease
LPPITSSRLLEILPAALSFTLLGGVESLLSAKVADGMTGRKHRYNMELVAQGIANMASALFGGISVTGTIARTATNVRAGASSPVAGILHSVFLLVFMLVAAPLARFIPPQPSPASWWWFAGTWRKSGSSCTCFAIGAPLWC